MLSIMAPKYSSYATISALFSRFQKDDTLINHSCMFSSVFVPKYQRQELFLTIVGYPRS